MQEKHKIFNKSKRKHVLIITNHGCHAPVIELTTDTAGQNFYVNDFSHALVKLGYKITILNRGGYKHPVTRELHRGIVYYGSAWGKKGIYCRLIYLEDGEKKFIPKERLKKHNLTQERDFFFKVAKKIDLNLKEIYFINSHYWDGGVLGTLINEELEKKYGLHLPHIWTPHSLGILKRENYKKAPKSVIRKFNFPSRIRNEEKIISQVEGIVSTSNKINATLSGEYKSRVRNHLWFPPGVDTDVFKPRTINRCGNGLRIIEEMLGVDREEATNLIKTNIVLLETGRTAKSKQKDLILKSFSRIENKNQAFLIMNVDPKGEVYGRIKKVYDNLQDKKNILLIERYLTDEEIAQIFSFANVYITASLMEGWGMAVQEAAGSKCAIISSKHVPFATEVLKENALVVNKNYPRLYAEKIDIMIQEPHLRQRLANNSYKTVSAHYSWSALTRELIKEMKKRKIVR
jgi:glycosyltransferase involved in cell wall biosynthesis